MIKHDVKKKTIKKTWKNLKLKINKKNKEHNDKMLKNDRSL